MRSICLLVFVAFVTAASPLTGLSFDDVTGEVDRTLAVKTAAAALEEAIRSARLLGYPGDVSATIQPSVTATTPYDGAFAETVSIGSSVSVTVPVGLSASRTDALEQARSVVVRAERELLAARNDAYLSLFTVYSNAWAAQQEIEALRLEHQSALAAVNAARRLFESGRISLSELSRAEETLRIREAAYTEGQLVERITWLELAYAVDLDPTITLELEAPAVETGELPKPPELTEWAKTHDPAVLAEIERIGELESEIASARATDLSAVVRANFSADSHTASVSYNVDSPSISASYAFPIVTLGAEPTTTGGSSSSWNLGVSVNLSLAAGRESSLERDVAALELERERIKLETLEDILALTVRSRYQQYLVSQEALEQAERTLERSEQSLELVLDRFDRGQLTEADVAEARSAVARAAFQFSQASTNVLRAQLATAAAASYLNEFVVRHTGV